MVIQIKFLASQNRLNELILTSLPEICHDQELAYTEAACDINSTWNVIVHFYSTWNVIVLFYSARTELETCVKKLFHFLID